MKWAQMEGNRVRHISLVEVKGWKKVSDNVFPGFTKKGSKYEEPPVVESAGELYPLTPYQFDIFLQLMGYPRGQFIAAVDSLLTEKIGYYSLDRMVARAKIVHSHEYCRTDNWFKDMAPIVFDDDSRIDKNWLIAKDS